MTTRTVFDVTVKRIGDGREETVGHVVDDPHEVARWLSDMAKKVKREAALMDHQEMMQYQDPLLGVEG